MDLHKRNVGHLQFVNEVGKTQFSAEFAMATRKGDIHFKGRGGKRQISTEEERVRGSYREKDWILPTPLFTSNPRSKTGGLKIISHDLTRAPAQKGWVKAAFLLAGCATNGEAWKAPWADMVREYLMSDGEDETKKYPFLAMRHEQETTECLLFVSNDERPGYVMVFEGWLIGLGIFKRYVDDDVAKVPLAKCVKGPFVYGCEA